MGATSLHPPRPLSSVPLRIGLNYDKRKLIVTSQSNVVTIQFYATHISPHQTKLALVLQLLDASVDGVAAFH